MTAARTSYLTPDEVAAELRVTVKTLRNWRYLDRNRPPHKRRGRPWIKPAGHVLYPRDGLDAWLARRP